MNNIITISREFGSGGRELGKRLADSLGYAYYDRELITILAKETDLNEDYLEETLEEGSLSNLYPITIGQTFTMLPDYFANHSTDLLREQTKLIMDLARRSNCVIVGRNADIILQDQDPLRLFIHADMAERIARCRRREKNTILTDKEYEKKINQIDKNRSKTHAILGDWPWGDRHGYELCVNTTTITIKDLIPALSAYAQKWFEAKH